MTKKLFLIILLLLAAARIDVLAQETGQEAAQEPEIIVPADDFDRGTPKRSVEGFVAAVDKADYALAAEYMDLRNLRGEADDLEPEQLARRLAVIVSRATWTEVEEMVDDPAGRSNDGVPPYRDPIGTILDEESGNDFPLYVQKVPRGDGVFIWKISNASVSLIPELYDVYGYPETIENVRRMLPHVTILGFELFKFVIALGVGISAYILVFLFALILRRLLGDPGFPSRRRIFRFFILPLGLWVFVLSASEMATYLGRGATAETWRVMTPIPTLITVWLLFGAINLARDLFITRQRRDGREGTATLVRPMGNALKLLIGVVATLIYLDKIGINITALVAGLGVGGVAVALALQKPMEDIFGAITLYAQQPVRVGDFCRFGADELGTIEEIGLRTTRVRTLANTVIAVPNSKLATEAIDNYSARKKILYRPTLRVRQDTTPDQMEVILAGIREFFDKHDRVLEQGQRVRFKGFASDALVIEAFTYIDTTDWIEYLEIAEELNLGVHRIVIDAGSGLSLPARALRIEQTAESS
jgi:MscS family membrane protein